MKRGEQAARGQNNKGKQGDTKNVKGMAQKSALQKEVEEQAELQAGRGDDAQRNEANTTCERDDRRGSRAARGRGHNASDSRSVG